MLVTHKIAWGVGADGQYAQAERRVQISGGLEVAAKTSIASEINIAPSSADDKGSPQTAVTVKYSSR